MIVCSLLVLFCGGYDGFIFVVWGLDVFYLRCVFVRSLYIWGGYEVLDL